MARFGIVYIAHNPNDGENVYKIGMSERDVDSRMAELTSETSNLGKYTAVAYFVVSDVEEAERAVHARLRHYRIQDNREFFELELSRLLPTIRTAIEPFVARDFSPNLVESERESTEEIALGDRIAQRRQRVTKQVTEIVENERLTLPPKTSPS